MIRLLNYFRNILPNHNLPDTVNILMTGAGPPGTAGIIKCLQQNWINLTVADADDMAIEKILTKDII